MTREEAIEDLLRHYTGESTDIAIESLEAWDKVIEEIENINDTVHDGTNHFYKTAEDIKTEVIDIINEHLGEVKE